MTDDDLRDLLTDAVSDVEPAYRLGEIQARVHRPARRGWYAAGGAILAAAAVVTAVSVPCCRARWRCTTPRCLSAERDLFTTVCRR